jgi:hypothetical protein
MSMNNEDQHEADATRRLSPKINTFAASTSPEDLWNPYYSHLGGNHFVQVSRFRDLTSIPTFRTSRTHGAPLEIVTDLHRTRLGTITFYSMLGLCFKQLDHAFRAPMFPCAKLQKVISSL